MRLGTTSYFRVTNGPDKDRVGVTRITPLTDNKPLTVILPMRYDDFVVAYARWQGGEYIQRAFAGLDADGREFLMTGIAPGDWDNVVKEPED
jgi:hypothetical protein